MAPKKRPTRLPNPSLVLPPSWPAPGSEAFAALPPADRRWVRRAHVWYRAACLAGAPSAMQHDPAFAEVEENSAYHYPFLVKYFLLNPPVFHTALCLLSGEEPEADTPEALQKGWQAWLAGQAAPHAKGPPG